MAQPIKPQPQKVVRQAPPTENFEDISEEEQPEQEQNQIEEEIFEEQTDNEEMEMSMDDISRQFVPHPKVGEETGMILVKQYIKRPGIERKDKEGNSFKVTLQRRDGRREKNEFVLKTDKGEYVITSWEVFAKVNDLIKKLNVPIAKPNIKINIRHIADGMKDPAAKKKKACYEVTYIP